MQNSPIEIGTRVRIDKKHWARARSWGKVVELLESGRFVVEFDKKGIGYDDGWKLQLGHEDIEES
jgi:hypothetical protein